MAAVARHIAGCVVVADYMKEWSLDHGFHESQIRKIVYGVPVDDYSPSTFTAAVPCRFLVVGNFVEKKRPDLTLQAFQQCVDAGADARLTVIGDADLRPRCEQILDHYQLRDRVTLLGRQNKERVRAEMQSASVFLQHSVTAKNGDMEGWPVAIGEAAACGLPVISTRHASIPEQVDHGTTGYLVDEHDWQEMGKRMLEPSASPDLRIAMGKAARAKAAQNDSAVQIAELEDFILEVATRNKS